MSGREDDRVTHVAQPVSGDAPTAPAGSNVDAGTTTESGPLGRVDPKRPAPPGTVPRPPLGPATFTVVAGLLGLIASLVLLGSIAEGVRDHEVFALDTWATPFLHAMASPGLNAFMSAFTNIGSSPVIVPIFVVVMVALLWKRRFGAASFLALTSGGALVLDVTMKLFFQRPRPRLAWARVLPDYSFPSGHTMNAVVFYIALALILWSVFGRRVGLIAVAVAIVLALAVGVTRIYLGYHYLTDVVGALLAGTAWLLIVGAAFRIRPNWWKWSSPAARPASRPDGPGRAVG